MCFPKFYLFINLLLVVAAIKPGKISKSTFSNKKYTVKMQPIEKHTKKKTIHFSKCMSFPPTLSNNFVHYQLHCIEIYTKYQLYNSLAKHK